MPENASLRPKNSPVNASCFAFTNSCRGPTLHLLTSSPPFSKALSGIQGAEYGMWCEKRKGERAQGARKKGARVNVQRIYKSASIDILPVAYNYNKNNKCIVMYFI